MNNDSREFVSRSAVINAVLTYWEKRIEFLPIGNNYMVDRYLEHNRILCNHINSISSVKIPPKPKADVIGYKWVLKWDLEKMHM